ncbi:uncharacterized protein V1516DRAFT_680411 [Lipomyces oligophaga]|uniref:uncharacterized protein n=1 Tax=Lipomyces oligophaga TaxID=45792 RepID=UPI0034CD4078
MTDNSGLHYQRSRWAQVPRPQYSDSEFDEEDDEGDFEGPSWDDESNIESSGRLPTRISEPPSMSNALPISDRTLSVSQGHSEPANFSTTEQSLENQSDSKLATNAAPTSMTSSDSQVSPFDQRQVDDASLSAPSSNLLSEPDLSSNPYSTASDNSVVPPIHIDRNRTLTPPIDSPLSIIASPENGQISSAEHKTGQVQTDLTQPTSPLIIHSSSREATPTLGDSESQNNPYLSYNAQSQSASIEQPVESLHTVSGSNSSFGFADQGELHTLSEGFRHIIYPPEGYPQDVENLSLVRPVDSSVSSSSDALSFLDRSSTGDYRSADPYLDRQVSYSSARSQALPVESLPLDSLSLDPSSNLHTRKGSHESYLSEAEIMTDAMLRSLKSDQDSEQRSYTGDSSTSREPQSDSGNGMSIDSGPGSIPSTNPDRAETTELDSVSIQLSQSANDSEDQYSPIPETSSSIPERTSLDECSLPEVSSEVNSISEELDSGHSAPKYTIIYASAGLPKLPGWTFPSNLAKEKDPVKLTALFNAARQQEIDFDVGIQSWLAYMQDNRPDVQPFATNAVIDLKTDLKSMTSMKLANTTSLLGQTVSSTRSELKNILKTPKFFKNVRSSK